MSHHSRLILFDIDGTLLRTNGIGRDSTRAAMLEVFGTDQGLDAHAFGGKTDWFTLTELLEPQGITSEIVGERMPVYEQSIARHLTEMIDSTSAYPCPGAVEIVSHLRDDSKSLLGIVTGNVSTTAPLKLRAAGFDPSWFPVCAYGSEAIDRNDLPALAIERATNHSGTQFAPENVIVIGDTPADIACARAVGAVAVAVCTGFASREQLVTAQPDYLLDDLTSLSEEVLSFANRGL